MQVCTVASGNTARIASGKPFRPERTKRPDCTDKEFGGVSENLSSCVSVYHVNPTEVSVQAFPRFSDLFWRRSRVCGKQLVSAILLTYRRNFLCVPAVRFVSS